MAEYNSYYNVDGASAGNQERRRRAEGGTGGGEAVGLCKNGSGEQTEDDVEDNTASSEARQAASMKVLTKQSSLDEEVSE